MTANPALVDGCEHCGNRTSVSSKHVASCADFYVQRRAARGKAEQFGVSPVCVDDLFAHLTTPRADGPWCTAETAVSIVECIAALGWRPVIGQRSEPRGIETREPQGDVL